MWWTLAGAFLVCTRCLFSANVWLHLALARLPHSKSNFLALIFSANCDSRRCLAWPIEQKSGSVSGSLQSPRISVMVNFWINLTSSSSQNRTRFSPCFREKLFVSPELPLSKEAVVLMVGVWAGSDSTNSFRRSWTAEMPSMACFLVPTSLFLEKQATLLMGEISFGLFSEDWEKWNAFSESVVEVRAFAGKRFSSGIRVFSGRTPPAPMVFFGSKIIGSEVIGGEITQIIGIEVQLLDIVAFILSIGGSVDNSDYYGHALLVFLRFASS